MYALPVLPAVPMYFATGQIFESFSDLKQYMTCNYLLLYVSIIDVPPLSMAIITEQLLVLFKVEDTITAYI